MVTYPPALKKNSVHTTIAAPGISDSDATIPVTELSVFYDKDGNLIKEGIVIGYLNADDTLSEEITITGASGTSGSGNLTGATRGVNADGSIGAGHAWAADTEIAVMFSTSIYNHIRLPNRQITLLPQGCEVPVTSPATVDQYETSTNKIMITYGEFSNIGTQYLQWTTPIEEGWTPGTNLTAIFNWTAMGGTVGNVAKWKLEAYAFDDGDALDTAFATGVSSAEDAFHGNEKNHKTVETETFTISGAGRFVKWRLSRDNSPSGTNLAYAARILSVKIKAISSQQY